jgi:hypothetical protein
VEENEDRDYACDLKKKYVTDNFAYAKGRTYTNQNINHTRLDQESQYLDCLSRSSDTDPTVLQQLAVFPVCMRM